MTRRWELMTGTLAAFAAVVGLAAGVFGETKTSVVIDTTGSWIDRTAWGGHGVDAQLVIYMLFAIVAAAAIAAGTYEHAVHDRGIGLASIWGGTTVLAVLVVLDLPRWSTTVSASGISTWNDTGVGVFLIPAVIFALHAGFVGLWTSDSSGRTFSARPM